MPIREWEPDFESYNKPSLLSEKDYLFELDALEVGGLYFFFKGIVAKG